LLLAQDVANDDAVGDKILDRPAWEAAPSLLGRPQNARCDSLPRDLDAGWP